MFHYQSLLAVAAGGAIGSLARFGALEIAAGDADLVGVDAAAQRAVIATAVINVLGSLLLGILIAQRDSMKTNQFLAAGAGFAGGLTTFSTFTVAVAESLDSGEMIAALSNGVGTAVAAVLAAGLGYRLGVLSR